MEIDAIVNAASPGLKGGGGVDGVIHSQAGPWLRNETDLLNGCLQGEAKLTKGYRLPAKSIIHTVAPLDKDPEILKSCYSECLKLVELNCIKSVAFCCLGTGAFGFPLDKATQIACKVVREWMEVHESNVQLVIFCVYSNKELDEYKKQMSVYFPL